MREDLNRRLDSIQVAVNKDILEIKERLEKLERKEFDPDRTIIFTKMPMSAGRSDTETVHDALGKAGVDVTVRSVKRMGKGIGVVACELETVKEKVKCLQQKMNIKNACGSHIRGSKTHPEIVMEQNIRTLLHLIPGGSDYRLTASGKLLKKEWLNNYNEAAGDQHLHGPIASSGARGGAASGAGDDSRARHGDSEQRSPRQPHNRRKLPSPPPVQSKSSSSTLTPGKPSPKRFRVEGRIDEQLQNTITLGNDGPQPQATPSPPSAATAVPFPRTSNEPQLPTSPRANGRLTRQ